MSSSIALVTAFESIQTYLYRFVCPILMIFGTISSTLNLIVFTQKTLRKNPCSVYFIAYNCANFIYIYSSLLSLTLDVGYHIDPSAYYLVICRLRLYFTILFNCLSPFYLILASIDRILITSPNALTRQKSTLRLAYLSIILGTLFWMCFHSHALVLTNIIQLGPNYYLCYFQQGDYLIFIGYYGLLKEIVAILSLTICGLWSIKNIRHLNRIRTALDLSMSRATAGTRLRSNSPKDRQMMFMLLVDITIYVTFSFVFGIFLMYQQITQNYMKSFQQLQIENVMRNLCLFSIGISILYELLCQFNRIKNISKRSKEDTSM